jgi:RNA polymerase sigma-70 factor (ECF subfamily)
MVDFRQKETVKKKNVAEFFSQLRFHGRPLARAKQINDAWRTTMFMPQTTTAATFGTTLPTLPTNKPRIDRGEADLVAASQRGDGAAYGTLVRKYQDRLCSSLRHVCRSSADAQDAAQEAFLRAYLKLGTYSGASGFYTWLYRIAINVAMSEHRRRKAAVQRESARSVRKEALADTTHTADARILRAERVEEVQNALRSLSDEQRTILTLREIEDFDYEEIAAILSIPVGTVRSRLHRARIALREKLLPVAEQDHVSQS